MSVAQPNTRAATVERCLEVLARFASQAIDLAVSINVDALVEDLALACAEQRRVIGEAGNDPEGVDDNDERAMAARLRKLADALDTAEHLQSFARFAWDRGARGSR